MSKTTQLFDLIMYVNSKKHFTAQDVAYEFNVSVRTAHRYLMELREMGIPIYTEKGRNGGFRIIKNRLLPPILFNVDEALAIYYSFQALKHYKTLPFNIDIQSVSRKLFQYFPEDIRRRVERFEDVLLFWIQKRSVASPLLMDIIEASADDFLINIEYQSKSGNSKKQVKPIGVYAHDGLWYMLAYDLIRDSPRIYRIDRVISMDTLDKTYPNPIKLMDWLAIRKTISPIRLFVLLNREGIRQCRSISWMEDNLTVDNEERGYIDTIIDKSEIEYISTLFFQMGKDATVIEPEEVINIMKRHAQDIQVHYESSGNQNGSSGI